MSTWKIMRLRCGQTVRDAVNFLGAAHAKEDYQVTFWSYAIWNEQYKILVDTGVNREDEQPWYTKVPNIVKDEERLDRQLEDHLGWKPEEVDAVIFTHLHYDHTGYAYLFKNAEFYVQKQEYEYGIHAGTTGFGLAYKKSNFDKHAVKYTNWRFLEGETMVFPGLLCFPTPGHTVGHQSVLADTEEGAVCITGDAVNCLEILVKDINAGPLVTGTGQKESYAKIRQVAERVCTSHDMDSECVYDHQTGGFPEI